MNTSHPPNGEHVWYRYALLVAFVAGLGFFALSFLLLGIIPGRSLATLVREQAPADMAPYTASEERGRQIYAAEGCAYCHSQQVRFVPADVARWGAPTEAWETKFDAPQLWGTRRIGPDLAREGGVRSDDWQLVHLSNPRLTVRDSIMPGYPWHFEGSAAKPNQSALDVVAYLQSLGRARAISGYVDSEGGSTASAMTGEHESIPGLVPPAHANPNAPILGGTDMPFTTLADDAASMRHGGELFAANCASCHGASGAGDGPAAPSLLPHPANLAANRYAPSRLAAVLWNGVAGASMPAFRDWPQRDLRDVAAFVITFAPARDAAADPADAVQSGEAVFATNCASCHGQGGAGDGPAAASMFPRPTNFLIEQPSLSRARDVLAHGVPGTAMIGWGQVLNETERDRAAAFVRSLYGTTEKP